MASIDKIYGNISQYQELYAWLKANNREAVNYLCDWDDDLWDEEQHPISNFPERIDMWLLENCPIEWVTDRIKYQYGLE